MLLGARDLGLHAGAEQLFDEAVAGPLSLAVAHAERPGTEHAPAGGKARADRRALLVRERHRRGQDEDARLVERRELGSVHLAHGEVLAREEFAPGREHQLVLAAVAAEESFGDIAAQEDERPRGACGGSPERKRGEDKDASEPTHGRLLYSGERAPLRRP